MFSILEVMFTISKLVSTPNLLMAIVIAVLILCIFLIYVSIKKLHKVSPPDQEGFATVNQPAVDAANNIGSYEGVKVYYDQIYQDAKSCDPKIKSDGLMKGYGVSSDMKNPINTAGINCSGQNDTGVNLAGGAGDANSANAAALTAANNNAQNLQNAVQNATSNYLAAAAAAATSGSPKDKAAADKAQQALQTAQAMADTAESAAKALADKNALGIAIEKACEGQPSGPCKELAAASAAAVIGHGLSQDEINKVAANSIKAFQDAKNTQETQTIQVSQNQGSMSGYDKNDNTAPSLGRGKSKCDMKPKFCGRNTNIGADFGGGGRGGAGGPGGGMGAGDGGRGGSGYGDGDGADNNMNNMKKPLVPSANAPSPALLASMMKAGIPVALSANDAKAIAPTVDLIAGNKMPNNITPDGLPKFELPAGDVLLLGQQQLANLPLSYLAALPTNILQQLPSNIIATLPQNVLDKLPASCKVNCVIPPRLKIPAPPPVVPKVVKVFDTKCEGVTGEFSCASGEKITGIKIKYGKWNKGSCPGPNSNTETVKFVDKVFQPAACIGKQKCSIPINDALCGNPIDNTRKEWIASPVCEKRIYDTKCEDDVGTFKCDGAKIMTGIKLKYGKWNQGSCPGANSDTETVQFNEKVVQPPECMAKQSCTIKVNNALGGDPFGGTRKEWTATPMCTDPPPPPPPPCICGDSNYTCSKDQDHGGDDIKCFSSGMTPASCAKKCEEDYDCLGYNVWTPLSRGGCCIKTKKNITGPNTTADFCAIINRSPRPPPPPPPPPPPGPPLPPPGEVRPGADCLPGWDFFDHQYAPWPRDIISFCDNQSPPDKIMRQRILQSGSSYCCHGPRMGVCINTKDPRYPKGAPKLSTN